MMFPRRHLASFLAVTALLPSCAAAPPTPTDPPPAWTERPYLEEEGQAMVVGVGVGPDQRSALDCALADARRLALETVAIHIRSEFVDLISETRRAGAVEGYESVSSELVSTAEGRVREARPWGEACYLREGAVIHCYQRIRVPLEALFPGRRLLALLQQGAVPEELAGLAETYEAEGQELLAAAALALAVERSGGITGPLWRLLRVLEDSGRAGEAAIACERFLSRHGDALDPAERSRLESEAKRLRERLPGWDEQMEALRGLLASHRDVAGLRVSPGFEDPLALTDASGQPTRIALGVTVSEARHLACLWVDEEGLAALPLPARPAAGTQRLDTTAGSRAGPVELLIVATTAALDLADALPIDRARAQARDPVALAQLARLRERLAAALAPSPDRPAGWAERLTFRQVSR